MTPIAAASLKISAGVIAFLIVMGIVLTMLVVRQRRSKRIGIGDGNDRELALAIRVHGNFVEHMPACFAVLILMPLLGSSPLIVGIIGLLIVAGRILHAIGLGGSAGTSFGRVGGMVTTQVGLLFAVIEIIRLIL